ncbi:hypothetical protein ACFC3F_06100 [Microbacterium sp. NPDC055910]|uniref:hypothetical protein n=1 Tax=Microbacterium sp. NPDC055910 TaxID=3345659 RepID=UPI0035DDD146
MSKHLVDVRTLDVHTSPVHAASVSASTRPVRLADRLALRVGLWLLLHSTRRERRDGDRELHTRSLANERSRSEREAAHLRQHLLSPRP